MPNYDICVIGAGPAGISIACKLKQLGFNILLIAEDIGSKRPMLQSLTPGVWTLLETIGLGSDPLRMGCEPQENVIQQWTDEIIHSPNPSGFLVDRREFDSHLFAEAKKRGIKTLQPARVIGLQRMDRCWEIRVLHAGKYLKINSAFLVDATGKRSVLHGKKIRVAPSTLAISGSWKNTSLPINSTILESAPDHWLWGAMMRDAIFHATVFLDPGLESRKGISALMQRYISAIESSRLFKDCLQGSLVGKLSAFDTTPYYYENAAGGDFIKVGEASFGLDPISSQGVQTGISNAIQGAIVVNTIFSNPSNATQAIDFYKQRQQESIANHLNTASGHYAAASRFQQHLFWRKRIKVNPAVDTNLNIKSGRYASSGPVQFSPSSTLTSTSCIINDQITTRLGLVHPSLTRPVVFWDNEEIGLILGDLNDIHTTDDLLCQWSERIPVASSVKLLHWLRDARILVPVNT